MSKWLASLDPEFYISAVSIRAHRRDHLMTAEARTVEDAKRSRRPSSGGGDLASLVRDNVLSRVEEGDLDPSIAEGLRAQEMLDRRVEKQGDRDMMLQLAGLLSGAVQPVALQLEDGNTIEGEFREFRDEEAEDRALFEYALAPLR